MAKAIKKVSVNAIDNAIKENIPESVTVSWNGLDIVVKTSLTFSEMLTFVNDVVNSCVGDDGDLMVEAKEYLVRYNFLVMYTNVNMPESLEHKYKIACCTDLVDTLAGYVCQTQFNNIMDSIDCKLQYIGDKNVAGIERQAQRFVDVMEDFQQKMEEMYSGIDADDIKKLVESIGNGRIDEEKIVNAYIDRTMPDGVDAEIGD